MTSMEKIILSGRKHKYELIEELGKGGMCRVYNARMTDSGKTVAVKELRRDKNDGFEKVRRIQFENEIRLMEMLTKAETAETSGIPQLVDHGEDFYAMELIEGDALAACYFGKTGKSYFINGRKKAKTVLQDLDLVRILCRVCGILTGMHERKNPVIHLDIKPSNIIIRKDGAPFLIDLGSAMELHGYDGAEPVCTGGPQNYAGTSNYAAPEQYGGSFIKDRRTDIYQFGKMIQTLADRSGVELFLKKELEVVAKRCMRTKASERYSDMREVKQALEKCPKNAYKKKISFYAKGAAAAFLFITSAFTIPAALKGSVHYAVPVLSVIAGHFIWNDESLLTTAREILLNKIATFSTIIKMFSPKRGKASDIDDIFINIVMTYDTIDIE